MSGLVVIITAAAVGWTFAQPGNNGKSVAAQTLHPQKSLIYFHTDGQKGHLDSWQQTAAYKAVHDSGLDKIVDKCLQKIRDMAEQEGQQEIVALGESAILHMQEHGLSLSVSADMEQGPTGAVLVVLHEAAEFEPPLSQLIRQAAGPDLEFETQEVSGRTVTMAMIPQSPAQLAWWTEGNHLVITAGIDAVSKAIAVADGDAPNVTSHALYKKYVEREVDFDVTTNGWVDVKGVRELVNPIPLPIEDRDPALPPVTVGNLLESVGLDGMNAVVSLSGFKGEALWGETWIEAPAPRKRLLSLSDGEPISLGDLPPLPFGMTTFSASRMNPGKAYDELLNVAHDFEKLVPDANGEVDRLIGQAEDEVGMNIRDDFVASLGDIVCVYDDTRQGILGMGAGVVVEVRNPDRCRESIEKILLFAAEQLENEPEVQLRVKTITKHGRDVVMFELAPSPFGQSFCIDGRWLVIGSPQVIEAFLLRVDGKLPTWEPSPEHLQAFAEVPKEFSAITVSDPRGTIRLVAGLAPMVVGLMEAGIQQSGEFPPGFTLPFGVEDVPPAELIAQPLFPNVVVAEVTDEGIHYTSRSSLPSLPLLGGGDAATTTVVVAVGVALLLPAVQAAREAARRTQSQNNLRQLALAMHNHHDAFKKFPSGTIANDDLKPEERLAWTVSLLPFLEQQAIYQQIDQQKGWKDAANSDWASVHIQTLENPNAIDAAEDEYGHIHYVGISGYGDDSAKLPRNHKRAGVFGYDATASIREITDGTSNTLMFSEASKDYGPWMQGGKSTIRGFSKQPYINGPDGIGSTFRGGCNMALCDGSVRFISENIDNTVLEALSTTRGGEVVGNGF